jgi:hypothetical protein
LVAGPAPRPAIHAETKPSCPYWDTRIRPPSSRTPVQGGPRDLALRDSKLAKRHSLSRAPTRVRRAVAARFLIGESRIDRGGTAVSGEGLAAARGHAPVGAAAVVGPQTARR